jgi:hypothetical protein
MRIDVYRWGSAGRPDDDGVADAVDDWLEDALCAVPLPDGFFARLGRLSELPPGRDDDRGRDGRCAPTRGLAGTAPRDRASRRGPATR